ncbi:fungal hydrophobin [Imleria badia]|nr:fungal hydrophobin [Imleria badia]
MFARVFKSTVIVSVIAFVAVARGVPTSTSNSQCNNGSLQCCNNMMSSTTAQETGLGGLLGLLGLNLGSIVGDIGLECTPINVIGVGSGANCNQQAACCTGETQNGLINVGCSPINLGL